MVIRGAADVTDKEVVNVLQSPTSASVRLLSLKRPEVWHGMVDVSASCTHAECAAYVVAELGRSDHEDQVAYRNGGRFALRVLPSTEELPSTNATFATEDVFVVTDGVWWGFARNDSMDGFQRCQVNLSSIFGAVTVAG